jgi:hypothetical protein
MFSYRLLQPRIVEVYSDMVYLLRKLKYLVLDVKRLKILRYYNSEIL